MNSFDQEFLSKLERLALQGTKMIFGGTGGNRRSKAKGNAIEFSDFREYTLGDDFRSIDWNAYARFERLFVKLYMEEREANITIFLDTSSSMNHGTPNKGILAKQLAAIFAYMALANYDRVGIAAISDYITQELPYFSGKPGFSKALKFLDSIAFDGNTRLKKAIMSHGALQGRKGITVLITDLFSQDDYVEAMQYLKYLQQDIVIIHIMSPEELNPQWTGSLRLIDVETGRPVEVEITPHTEKLYKKALESHLDDIKRNCSAMEIFYVQVVSYADLDDIVFKQLHESGIIR